MAPYPSLTKEWHSQPYDAINPSRPELAVWEGKVIAITGGGGTIGRATTLAFATAGATKIAVLGRRPGPLEETKRFVETAVPGTEVLVVIGDVSDAKSIAHGMSTVAATLGKIDLLIANAGFLSKFAPIAVADPDEWWTSFEINTRGAFNLARAFAPHAAATAVVIDMSTCVAQMPAIGTASAYVASKLAGTKVWEMFGVENEHVDVVHMHPGVVESEINIKSGMGANDSADLPAQFAVWAVSPEAKKFRGKFLWCNWDVPELKSREEELSHPDKLTITLNGWPYEK